MSYFIPKRFPSLMVYFWADGQKQTFHDPGFDDEIEFTKIEVDGVPLDDELESYLIETFAEDWAEELKALKFDRGDDDY